MSEPKHGVGAVVAEAANGEVAGAPAAEISGGGAQAALPLLEEIAGPEDAESPVGALVRGRRGPGRPPGATNKLTRDIRKLILSQHKHPLLALAEIYSLDTKALAVHLGCKAVEALDRQVRAAAELAPYLAAKQAAVDDDGRTVLPMLQLNFGGPAPAALEAAGGTRALSILDVAQLVENQRVSEGEGEASHGYASHDMGQAIDNEGESDD
ncbi:hypothetical protein [Xanthobacter versatilis]|uniref:hypothetical protein n=1 Tax=Xanthobacter autotrophicus (strain ATCC BAA-1158 / Py2) TaxID=78245 RepID=UPI00372ADA60